MSSPPTASTSAQIVSNPTVDEKKKPLPRWVPVSLLAVTTAALALPIYLLKRHRASLAELSPPARRTAKAAGRLQPARIKPVEPNPQAAEVPADAFNAPLQGLKAFGIATMGVTTCAAAGVWGVKAYTGVRDTREFADYMRQTLLLRLPGLAARLHRLPDPDSDSDSSPSAPSPSSSQPEHATGEPWTWAAAEARLRAAYEQRGFAGWADAALREVEEEARVERAKRGLGASTET